MKNIFNTVLSKRVLSLTAMTALVLASCIKEGEDEIEGIGSSFFRITSASQSFGDASSKLTFSTNFAVSAFDAKKGEYTLIEIKRDANSAATNNAAATVNYAIDNTIVDGVNAKIDAYNADLDLDDDGEDDLDPMDNFTILGPELYSIVGTSLTFNSGEFIKGIKLNLDPSTFDFSLKYAIGLKLSNPPDGYKLSSEFGSVLIQVIVKNKWHGDYNAIGHFGHPSSPRDYERIKKLDTKGATTLELEVGDLGCAMLLEVHDDNTLAILSACQNSKLLNVSDEASRSYPGNVAKHPWSYYDNMYHPETKSFRLRYGYIGGTGPRTVTEEVTLK